MLFKIVLQHEVVEVEHLAQLRGEAFALEQVRDPHRAPRHLVLVGRSDAASGSTNGVGTARVLPRPIERHVRRQDQWAIRRDPQAVKYRDALVDEFGGLGGQRLER